MDSFLGRALTDPETGLPNIPYFCLIQNWEQRQARRRQTMVRVLRLHVAAGGSSVRRALMWRLCQELRTSDLIASAGKNDFRVLLTTPDAECAESIAERLGQLTMALNDTQREEDDEALTLAVEIEHQDVDVGEKGPCDPCEPCEEHELLKAAAAAAADRHADAGGHDVGDHDASGHDATSLSKTAAGAAEESSGHP